MQDEALWLEVCKTIRPLPGRMFPKLSALPDLPPTPSNTAPLILQNGRNRKEAWQAPTPQTTDPNRIRRLRQGKDKIHGRLDLHGLDQRHAFDQFQRFVFEQYDKNHRITLIITGKGQGILKRGFMQWIDHPNLRPFIHSVAEALPRHGGTGAYYLFLRRSPSVRNESK